jgi:hypothetical protein
MKAQAKALPIAASLLIAAVSSVCGQGATYMGVLNYNTLGVSNDLRVWVNDTGLVGDGVLASGSSYQTALFWGLAGTTDPNQLVQIGPNVNFLTGIAAGCFFGAERRITYTSPPYGGVVALQSRAWQVDPGVTGWDNAQYKGSGPIIDMRLKDPNISVEPNPTISQHSAWRGYAIIIPEPSTIALGLLGAGALLILGRPK